MIPNLHKLSQKIEWEVTLNSFYKASIILLLIQDKDSRGGKKNPKKTKKNYRIVSLLIIETKILNKIIANWIQLYRKSSITTIKWDLFQ